MKSKNKILVYLERIKSLAKHPGADHSRAFCEINDAVDELMDELEEEL